MLAAESAFPTFQQEPILNRSCCKVYRQIGIQLLALSTLVGQSKSHQREARYSAQLGIIRNAQEFPHPEQTTTQNSTLG